MDKIDIDYSYKTISIIMATITTTETCAFVFSHTYFPNYRKVLIKKSTRSAQTILDKLNTKSCVPGKWHIEYILFDINFTKVHLNNFLHSKGTTIENDCYKISKFTMIDYLQQVNVEYSTNIETVADDETVANVETVADGEQEFMTIYGIGVLPVPSPSRLLV